MKEEEKKAERPIRIACVLMAAGQARRFGRNKLLEPVEGKVMVSHVLEQMSMLAAQREQIAVECGVYAELCAVTCWPEVAALCEEYGISLKLIRPGTQSDTIREALSGKKASRWQGCMFITADQPYLRMETMKALITGFAKRPDCVHRAAFGERQASPVLFPAAYFDQLRSLRGETGGWVLLRNGEIPVVLHQVRSRMEVVDIDTQEDLNMSNTAISTMNAPAAIGPYSQAIRAGETIYISGQLPIVPAAGEFAGEDIASQTRQSLTNIREILKEEGCSMKHVVKTTVLLRDIADFAAMNEVYAEFFEAPFPARAAFQAAALPRGARVEIEAVAVKTE